MDKDVFKKALKELADFIKETVDKRVQEYGKNRKGMNTLVGSDLVNDMKVKTSENSVELIIADYWMYVSTGWKFNDFASHKQGLLNALVNWATRKNIVPDLKDGITQDEAIWRFAKALYFAMIKHGREIPARPFLEFKVSDDNGYEGEAGGDLTYMVPELIDSYIDEWFEKLWNSITEDLDKYFNE